MHVVHVVRDLNRSSGGPSRSIPATCQALAESNLVGKITLFYRSSTETLVQYPSGLFDYQPIGHEGVFSQLIKLNERHPITVIHIHGLWSPDLHRAIQFAIRYRVPYVVSTRGMLSDWCMAYKPWRKKIAMLLYQLKDLKSATILHATSEDEHIDIMGILRRDQSDRVRIISNGCELPSELVLAKADGSDTRRAVSMGRLHPVKGYDKLIHAWNAVRPLGWTLRIAGPSEDGYGVVLQGMIEDFGLQDSVSLIGPIEDESKWSFLASSDLFVLTSSSENFGMSIAEALAAGKPVLCTTGTPWSIVSEHRCGWWVPPSGCEIENALRTATGTSDFELREMGTRARELIKNKFSWSRIAREFAKLYQEIATPQK